MKTQQDSKSKNAQIDEVVNEQAVDRANVLWAAAKQRLRLVKDKYKTARKHFKEAKQEAKRLRQRAAKLAKQLKRQAKNKVGKKKSTVAAKVKRAKKHIVKRAQAAKAQTVFWSVVDAFLLDPAQAAKLGAKGRYWVSRALLELGQIHEEAGRLDEAQRAYQLIVDHKLAGTAQAQAKLARFGAAGGTKP